MEVWQEENLNTVLSDLDDDLHEETQQVARLTDDQLVLKVMKLGKTYRKKFRLFSSQDQRALDQLTIGARPGQVLGLLGHNGAGKTTAIHMLTGLISPSFGDAFVFGKSIISDIDSVRAMSGVVPQENIYWPNLTLLEHCAFFARLRRVARPVQAARNVIAQVGLDAKMDSQLSTLSGGQKRRAMLAMALVGDPQILFLDEVSSGLDPLSRLSLWKLIEQIKKDRCVVLTTHDLEEANALSDKIGILALGRLRAVGTPLHLKNRYGEGYILEIVADTDAGQPELIEEAILNLAPTAVLTTSTAGQLQFSVTKPRDLQRALRYLEDQSQGPAPLVRDWNVSQTTLDSVFLRVTHGVRHKPVDKDAQRTLELALERDDGLDDVVAGDDGGRSPLCTVTVRSSVSLADVRLLVQQQPVVLPDEYVFVVDGSDVVSRSSEDQVLAFDCLPRVHVRPVVVDTATDVSTLRSLVDDLRTRLEQSKEENVALRQQLAQLQKQLNSTL